MSTVNRFSVLNLINDFNISNISEVNTESVLWGVRDFDVTFSIVSPGM